MGLTDMLVLDWAALKTLAVLVATKILVGILAVGIGVVMALDQAGVDMTTIAGAGSLSLAVDVRLPKAEAK